jgi:hypothetical protein
MDIIVRRLLDIVRAMGLQDRNNNWEFRIEHVSSTIVHLKGNAFLRGEIYTWCRLNRDLSGNLFTDRLREDEGYDFSSFVGDKTESRLIMTLQGFLENYIKRIKEPVVTITSNRWVSLAISESGVSPVEPVIHTGPYSVVQNTDGVIHIVDPISQPEVLELRLAEPVSDGIRTSSS